jgi:Flp pilus assembly protein CpaB
VHTVRKILSTREGTLAVAALAAIIAVAVLLAFIHGYKRSLDISAEPVTVLVAKQALPQGSSGDQIAAKGLFQATAFKREQVKEGAITDPGSLRGLVATHALVPGQQLTTSDFAKPSDPVLSKLADDQRAVTVPLDSAHGMIGQVQAGDHVDVLAGFSVQPDAASRPRPLLRTLLQDVEVLKAPPVGGTSTSGFGAQTANQVQNVVLRVTDQQAAELAFSSDNGKVWIVLRPQAGAREARPSLVTLERLLTGLPPLPLNQRSAVSTATGGGQ